MSKTERRFVLPGSTSWQVYPPILVTLLLAYATSKAIERWVDHSLAVVVFMTLLCAGMLVLARLSRVEVLLGAEELRLRPAGSFGGVRTIPYSEVVRVAWQGNGLPMMLAVETRGQGTIVLGPWLATFRKIDGDLQAAAEAISERIARSGG